MKLSELNIGQPDNILVDADFEQFGVLSSVCEGNMLTYLENDEFSYQLDNKKIKCIICKNEYVKMLPGHIKGIIISEHPEALFWKLFNDIGNIRKQYTTTVGKNCIISPDASIAKKNVTIGDNVVIEDFVVIHENVKIGNDVVIHSGSVIGGTGLEVKTIEGKKKSISHFGGVVIENNAEIYQLVSIERALFPWDNTVIGENTWISDMVLVSHACKIGKNCILAGKGSLCGSVVIEDDVWIGPGVIVVNSLTIGQGCYIALGSIVRKSVDAGKALVNDQVMNRSTFEMTQKMYRRNMKK